MSWSRRSGRSTLRRHEGRRGARGIPLERLFVGGMLDLGLGLGLGLVLVLDVSCYRGDFLELACDRQGACVSTDSGSSGGLATSATTGPSVSSSSTSGATTAGSVSLLDAYRLSSVTIVDPHFYYDLGGCGDRTALMNFAIAEETKPGGSVNMMLLFDPADPSAANTPLVLAEGDCSFDLDGTRCWQREGGSLVMIAATNSPDLACDVTLPATVNPLYVAEGAPNVAPPPCFTSPRGIVSLPSLAEGLPPLVLYDAQLAASYELAGAEVNVLKSGLLTGFISESSARGIEGLIADLPFNLWGTIAGGDGCQPDINNPIDDTDQDPNPANTERGIQMYLNFEAERVIWLE